jgi:6-pyruvoyl-tetrahydropterin synthase
MEEQSVSRKLTGVSAVLSAAHRSREGVMHGHTWEIIAWWEAGEDALVLQQRLRDYLKIFDHTVLGDDIAWGEALGTAMIHGLDCVEVEVRRPLEGIFARVSR